MTLPELNPGLGAHQRVPETPDASHRFRSFVLWCVQVLAVGVQGRKGPPS